MDVFCMAGVHQQPEQSTFLAEGQIKTYKLSLRFYPIGRISMVPHTGHTRRTQDDIGARSNAVMQVDNKHNPSWLGQK